MRLERPSPARQREFLLAVRRSRRLHGAWVAPPATHAAYRRYVRRLRRPTQAGYLVCRRDSGALVGVVNISEIVRGPLQSAYLGYYAFTPEAGRGLMMEGLALASTNAGRSSAKSGSRARTTQAPGPARPARR
ncbi:MAG TPA: GNAT family N-acetyltransferase [Methylomirabilota bacterium]|nr:GNAT family N-acetyltransferase [Methylomirabilota bacterium]